MKLASLTLMLAVLVHGREVWASRALQITLAGCEQLSESEVQRLAELELATVGGGESNEGSAAAQVECSGDEARILAREPGTGRSLSRTLTLTAELQDRERVVAIAMAQLVRALDWLPSQPPPATLPMPTPSAGSMDRRAPPAPAARVELEAAAGLRLRDLQQTLLAQRFTLASTLRLSADWALGAAFAFENGNAKRASGDVRAQLLVGSVRLKAEPWRRRHVGMLVRGDLGLAHVSLRGQDAEPSVRTAAISGLGLEGALALGPVLRVGAFAVALLGQGGGAYFGGSGLVTSDAAVTLDGAWLGAELALRIEL